MTFIADYVRDNGLTVLDTEAEELHICSQEPVTYAEAKTTYTLGNKTALAVSAPADGKGGGRAATVSAITDGSVTGTDVSCTHIAVVDVTNTRLLATKALSAPQAVTSGNTFTLTAFEIRFPDSV